MDGIPDPREPHTSDQSRHRRQADLVKQLQLDHLPQQPAPPYLTGHLLYTRNLPHPIGTTLPALHPGDLNFSVIRNGICSYLKL